MTPRTLQSLIALLALATPLAAQIRVPAAAPTQPPLSSVIGATLDKTALKSFASIPALVRSRADDYARGKLARGLVFPLENATDDTVRAIAGLQHNVIVSWLDPLTSKRGFSGPRFGANCDFTAYFGYGWRADWGSENGVVGRPPQFQGRPDRGMLWVNHEYVSNSMPTPTSAPTGQALTFAKYLLAQGVLKNDVTSPAWKQADIDTFLRALKRELGGSYFAIVQDPETRQWQRSTLPGYRNRRYDATSETLARIVGYTSHRLDADDTGQDLGSGIVAGILGDCAGSQTPWGTVISAEENVQLFYGDLEACWSPQNRFLAGNGFDACLDIRPEFRESRASIFGVLSNETDRHDRDQYGFLAEIDINEPAASDAPYTSVDAGGRGRGHRKLGVLGRARWENGAIVVGRDWRLVDGQPIVLYSANDRASGRVYRFVTKGVYLDGMTRPRVRALLDAGTLYVAHFADLDFATGYTLRGTKAMPTEAKPGKGVWIELSTTSQAIAPNAAALGFSGLQVGAALRRKSYNRIGGFPDDNALRLALFTACNKIGIAELNRPEDLEWNPVDSRLYVACTNHTRQVACDASGRVYDPAKHATAAPRRRDAVGSIFVVQEDKPSRPAASKAFRYWIAWRGSAGRGAFDAANPDNILIDKHGGVWFTTDGNWHLNGRADALYYLDLDPAHKKGAKGVVNPSFGRGFRIIAGPADSETTGPSWSSDMTSLFVSFQHPGETTTSHWPPRGN